MEPTQEKLPESLSKQVITIKNDYKCPICREPVMDPEKKELVKPVLNSKELGAVHEGCFVPFMGEANLRILFKILCYSIGDTISVTPVIREVRRIYPKVTLDVMTFFPEIFVNNPYVNGILDLKKEIPQAMVDSYHFQLNSFDPKKTHHFATHSVDFAANCALDRALLPTEWQYDLNYKPEDKKAAIKCLIENGVDPEKDKVILIHPHGTEWSTRDWGKYRFQALADKIRSNYPEYKMISVGGARSTLPRFEMKNFVPTEGAIELYGALSLLQSSALMDLPCVKLMITPDTGTLHMASARPELPIVGIFTLIKAFFRTPVRNGRLGYKFIGVESESNCNCTYNARFVTEELNLQTCPKAQMLEKVQWTSLAQGVKQNRLMEADPEGGWEDLKGKKIGAAIRRRQEAFKPNNLPCFPSVDRVFKAVEMALEKWGDA